MSRTKKFMNNVAAAAGLQALIMLAGIITPRIMLVYYGSEINGLVSSITQFVAYFNIVEAGLGGAVIFSLYKPLAEKNINAISNIVTAAKGMYYKTGILFSSLIILLALIYPAFVNVTDMGYSELAVLVVILGANGVLDFFLMAKHTTLFTADQRLYIISLANGLQVLLSTFLIYILAVCQVDIIILRAAVAFVIFLKAVFIKIYAARQYKEINYNSKTPDFSALNKRWDVLYLQVLGAIQNATPVVLLTIFLDDLKIVSVYVIYNMVLTGVNGVLGIFMNGLQSGFGELIAKKELEKLQAAFSDFEFSYYNLIGVAYLVTFITIQPFVKLYTAGIDDIDYNVPLIAMLFVANALLYNLKTPQGMLVLSAGLYRETRWQTTIQGAIALFLGIALVFDYGIVGVLAASIAANVFRDCEIPYFIAKNVTKLNSLKSYGRIIFTLLITASGVYCFNYISFTVNNYFDWLLLVMEAAVYAGMLFFIAAAVYDLPQLKRILQRFKRR